MNSNTNIELDCDGSFDCSYYLGHNIELPQVDSYNLEYSPMKDMNNAIGNDHIFEDQDYSFSAAKLKQFELNESSRRSSTEDFYPLEYSELISCMNQCDLEDFTNNDHELNHYRETATMEDGLLPASMMYDESEIFVPNDLIEDSGDTNFMAMFWKQLQPNEFLGNVARYKKKEMEENSYDSKPQFHNLVEEYLNGFGVKRRYKMDADNLELSEEDQNRKRRLCRHFLKGHCKRGKACDFLHDPSIFCPNSQKVFLGGLPAHITEVTLRQKLAQQGYKVINKPKVLRGFTPQVCMASVEEAQKLIEKRNILIDGSLVDVRAYEAFAKGGIDESRPDEIKRSVFLGGLSKGTTSQMIKDDLQKMDVKVINHPLVKTGFTPKVTFGTVKETDMLIKLKKVCINDTLVDVRPYVNFKSPFRCSSKKQK